MPAIIFANCAILDGTSKERREDHHVLVEDGHIREVSDRPIKIANSLDDKTGSPVKELLA